MNRYFVRPLFWNSGNYQAPTGAKATSGYPFDHGFGHEEWNNNPGNKLQLDGALHRVFYMTDLKPKLEIGDDDNVVIFFVASQGTQYLLGIASNASEIIGRSTRLRIAKSLRFEGRWREAWEQVTVQERYDSPEAFRKFWIEEALESAVTWKCPEDQFVWFDRKRQLNVREVTGKDKFPTRYNAFQELTPEQVQRLLSSARVDMTNLDQDSGSLVLNLKDKLEAADDELENDLAKINLNTRLDATTRKALIDARCGQGRFRSDLLRVWKGSCCVTSCTLGVALRASHIRPWKDSGNTDRLDCENGLMLVATLDALFDRGWISFADDGAIQISESISKAERDRLGLVGLRIQRPLTAKQKINLSYHRREKFDKHRTV